MQTFIVFLIIQGIETSSMVVSNAILMMAMHPDVQQRVYDEIKSLGCDDDYGIENVADLPYTEMVLYETMRLFPPVHRVYRIITQPTELANCTLPVGTICVIPIYWLHRLSKVWGDDCDRFNPDRFSAEQCRQRDRLYYMPFLAGPRNCLGHKYAMISMKVLLCHLMTRFCFHTEMKLDELKFTFIVAMKLINKYAVTAVRR